MKKFTVYFLMPIMVWEEVEAKDGNDAIDKCDIPEGVDLSEPWRMIAKEEKVDKE